MYRNRKFLDLAHKMNECMLCLPGVCEGYSPEGLEPAHSNMMIHGKATGQKSHDCFFVASCRSCHHELDHGNSLDREGKQLHWYQGYSRTMLYLFENNLINIKR